MLDHQAVASHMVVMEEDMVGEVVEVGKVRDSKVTVLPLDASHFDLIFFLTFVPPFSLRVMALGGGTGLLVGSWSLRALARSDRGPSGCVRHTLVFFGCYIHSAFPWACMGGFRRVLRLELAWALLISGSWR